MKKTIPFIILILIFFLGATLRFYRFTSNPPGLYIDEVAIGYNAYSILETGKDEWGAPFPLLFRSFGDYKPPLYIYTTAISEKIFGVNEVGVRLPSVLAGVLSVVFLFGLVLEMGKILKKEKKVSFSPEKIALLAALFLSVSPWHLQFSRAGFEANLALSFILAGLWLFLFGMRKNYWFLLFSGSLFVASIYTYHSARVFTPPFVFILMAVFFKRIWQEKSKSLVIFLFCLILAAPFIPTYFSKEGLARFGAESVVQQKGNIIDNFISNYVANFSSDFLFFQGDQAGRHSVKKIGELFLWQMPFILIGLIWLIKIRSKISLIIISWLLLAGVPPALTSVSPHALRNLIAVPVWQILAGFGVFLCAKNFWKKGRSLFWAGLSTVVVYALLLYLHIYHIHYPVAYGLDWSNGVKEAVAVASKMANQYDGVYLYSELPYVHLLFYLKFSPQQFQASNHDIINIGQYHYLSRSTYPQKTSPNQKFLMISPPWLVSGENEAMIREIRMLNGDPIFRIYAI